MATDASRGMNFLHLHEPPILHCDLKSQNLLVDQGFSVKVADFGLSRFQLDDPNNATKVLFVY